MYGLLLADLERRCTRDHPHVKIQGSLTKASAIYTPEMGLHLAVAFWNALLRATSLEEPNWGLSELELVVSIDFVMTADWHEVASWSWKRSPHINVLEVSSAVRVLHEVGFVRPHSRFLSFVDSSVARGALANGRSTSRMLQPLLRRACVLQVCFDLYPCWPYCPTRLNTADDPTRDVAIREKHEVSIRSADGVDFRVLHMIGLKRVAATWVRLLLLASTLWF